MASQIQTIDKATNLLADASCPDDFTAAFLDGTAPTDTCDHKGGMNGDDHRNIFQKIFGIGKPNELALPLGLCGHAPRPLLC